MKVLNGRIWTYEEISEIPEHSIILNGKEVEIMAASVKHGRWVFEVSNKLNKIFRKKYIIMVGEVGILINRKPLLILSADIVLISKKKLKDISDRILEIAPDLIIEIEKEKEEVDIDEKINYYSSIGIKKQVWILLSKREVLVIEDNKRSTYHFDDEIELLEGKKMKFSDIEKEVFE
ncbi:MAG: Uma2 family endonuclease [candidate division WOR-3 bacterium]